MTEKFEVSLYAYPHYVKYKGSGYSTAGVSFDILCDGKTYGFKNECSDIGLKALAEKADAFLSGRVKENETLYFKIPWIAGCCENYNYYFDIRPGREKKDGYWAFNLCSKTFGDEEREIIFSCVLTRELVKKLKKSVERAFAAFDWKNYGKTEFFRLTFPERKYEWRYSAKELENELSTLTSGDRLKAVYVSGRNYSDPLSVKENLVNYYVGSRVYLEFEKKHIDLKVHAMGLFEARVFESREVEMTRFYGFLEDDCDDVLCDTGYVFGHSYKDKLVKGVNVSAVDYYPWDAKGFDESQAGDPMELPEGVTFTLEDESRLSVVGWDDDFIIRLEPNE